MKGARVEKGVKFRREFAESLWTDVGLPLHILVAAAALLTIVAGTRTGDVLPRRKSLAPARAVVVRAVHGAVSHYTARPRTDSGKRALLRRSEVKLHAPYGVFCASIRGESNGEQHGDSAIRRAMEGTMEPRDPIPNDLILRDPSSSPNSNAGTPPMVLLEQAIARGDFGDLRASREAFLLEDSGTTSSRRSFLQSAVIGSFFGSFALAMAACSATTRAARIPPPEWSDVPATSKPPVVAVKPAPKPPRETSKPPGETNPVGDAALPWAKPRYLWAKAPPDFANLNPMLPVTSITVHHDGLDDLVYATDTASMAARIDHYRMGHRGKGWADIGYHLIIDRSGTLWQGRAIRWQGAHVKNHNEGNIGVLVMGNFERQQPTAAQMKTLDRVLRDLMRTYRVSKSRVYTHREWPDAETACPGRNLQPKVASLRTRLA